MQGEELLTADMLDIQNYFVKKIPTLLVWKTFACDKSFREVFYDLVTDEKYLPDSSALIHRYFKTRDCDENSMRDVLDCISKIYKIKDDLVYAYDWISPDAKNALEILREKKIIS
jgi:hypothetical protein